MPKKVILDVDTGSDDAVAIMLAQLHPDIDLVAVCSVAGNVPIENTTENTLRVRDLLKADFPVYEGSDRALVREACPWRIQIDMRADAMVKGEKIHIHEDYLRLPPSTRPVSPHKAPMFYVHYLMKPEVDKVTICAVGPLTNIALAIMIEPKILDKIEEIVVMGGACDISNASSSAEFNIFRDPEAAQRVFRSGAKITLVPLDATHRAVVTKDDCKRFREINNPVSDFAADLCDLRILVHTQQQPLWLPDSCALHDALAVAYIIDPSVLTDVRFLPVDVSLSGLTDGQTVVDQRTVVVNPNVHYAFDGDRVKFVNILCDAFKRFNN